MLFINAEDFFAQAEKMPRLTREEERRLAQEMTQDPAAREQLLSSYFPMVAAYIRRAPQELHTLHTVYVCLDALEKAVDSFNFLQDGERFSHRLSWRLRQCLVRCLADRT